jgi:hypothetical protein
MLCARVLNTYFKSTRVTEGGESVTCNSVTRVTRIRKKKYDNSLCKSKKKSKAVPLRAMKALGERGDIAPTHSRPRH